MTVKSNFLLIPIIFVDFGIRIRWTTLYYKSKPAVYWRAYDYFLSAVATGNRTWSQLDTDLFTRFSLGFLRAGDTGRVKLIDSCTLCDSSTHSLLNCPLGEISHHGKGLSNRHHQALPLLNERIGHQTCARSLTPVACAL